MITVLCAFCGASFQVKAYRTIKSRALFCSRAHRWEAVRTGAIQHQNAASPILARLLKKVGPFHLNEQCWEWRASMTSGYGNIIWNGRVRKATRVMWELLIGDLPNNLMVCHHCDNPACIRPSHLFLGSATDNMRDAQQKGRLRPPTPFKKLTENDIPIIRKRLSAGESCKAIALDFGVDRTNISMIKRGKSWRRIA